MKKDNIIIHWLVTLLLVILIAIIPVPVSADPPPPPNGQSEWVLAAFIVAGVAAAVGGIIILAKKTEPKYYWIMDPSESPATFWVGTTTRKECSINGWKRIGGPYASPAQAPAIHPSPTNTVTELAPQVLTITVQEQRGTNWVNIGSQTCDTEDFGYFIPTTNKLGFYRLSHSIP